MATRQFASFYIGDNLFGIDIRLIREINRDIAITQVDRAPAHMAGLLNLRGQIVTVLDIGVRMGLRETAGQQKDYRCIVLKTSEELAAKRQEDPTVEDTSRDLVALYVDKIGDMISIDENDVEPSPANIGEVEGEFISGVAKLEQGLMIIVKVGELLAMEEEKAGK